jgi:hypothetical protein
MVNMTTEKQKGFEKHAENPFKGFALVASTKKASYEVSDRNISIVNEETGERISEATHMSTFYKVDNAKFTKLYEGGLQAIFDLKSPGMKVLKIVLQQLNLKPGTDEISLSYIQAKDELKQSTYTRGVRELVDAKIIAPAFIPARWYINPAIIFNGDRLVLTARYEREGKSITTIDNKTGEITYGK